MKPTAKTTKIWMAAVASGILLFGALPSAYAADATATDTATTSVTTTNDTPATTTTDAATTTTGSISTSAAADASAPDLLPGEFFYFVKTMVEQINLALTFQDLNKAKLLADYAQERMAEAQALVAKGQTDLAGETLQKALTEQEQSAALAAKLSGVDAKAGDKTSAGIHADGTAATDHNASAGADASTTASSTPTAATTEGGAATSDEAAQESVTAQAGQDNPQLQELNAHLTQNITTLNKVLAKVSNPVAKAKIERNIEKSFAHLSDKLAKIGVDATLENSADANDGAPSTAAVTSDAQVTLTNAQNEADVNDEVDLNQSDADVEADKDDDRDKAEGKQTTSDADPSKQAERANKPSASPGKSAEAHDRGLHLGVQLHLKADHSFKHQGGDEGEHGDD